MDRSYILSGSEIREREHALIRGYQAGDAQAGAELYKLHRRSLQAAACCAAGIKELPVLEGIETLTILGEIDDGGANARALAACADRWLAAGRELYEVAPLIGGDFNDVWKKVA
jgi:hypothetical protein